MFLPVKIDPHLYISLDAVSALQHLASLVEQLHDKLVSTSQDWVGQRRPLVRKAAARVADVKQYNPQFEEEFVAGKDYDPDRSACSLLALAACALSLAPALRLLHSSLASLHSCPFKFLHVKQHKA